MPKDTAGQQSTGIDAGRLGASRDGPRHFTPAVLLALMTLWITAHSWEGIRHDGVLYAGQAMLRLRPEVFQRDLFFAWGSQDDFTIFGRLYAFAVERLGLTRAALVLWAMTQLLWFAAAVAWIRRLVPPSRLLPVAAAVFALPAFYSSDVVLRLAEPFLTARSLAEPLVLGGILASVLGHRVLGAAQLALAFIVHPVMALPGIVIVLAQPVPSLDRLRGWRAARPSKTAMLGLVVVLCSAVLLLQTPGVFERMDEHWYGLVRQRSNLVMVSAWTALDWMRVLLPLSVLALSARHTGERWTSTWSAIALCGALGLVLALLSSIARWKLGLQAQFWRLAWPAVWAAPLVSLAAASGLARVSAVHRILLLAAVPALALQSQGWWSGAWVLSAAYVVLLAAAATGRIPETPTAMRIALTVAILLGAAALVDGIATLYVRLVVMDPGADFDASTTALAIGKFGWLLLPAAVLVAQRACERVRRPRAALAGVAAMLLAAVWTLDGRSPARVGFERMIGPGIADWSRVIPLDATVFWPQHLDRVWLVLGRRSYVSRGQLAGGIFGREVVLEGNRRARNVETLELGDEAAQPKLRNRSAGSRPLARADIERACADPALDFVVLQTDLGATAAPPHLDPVTKRTYHLHRCTDFRVS